MFMRLQRSPFLTLPTWGGNTWREKYSLYHQRKKRADTPIRPYNAPCGFPPVGADQCIRPNIYNNV